jgi:hypothetical protein
MSDRSGKVDRHSLPKKEKLFEKRRPTDGQKSNFSSNCDDMSPSAECNDFSDKGYAPTNENIEITQPNVRADTPTPSTDYVAIDIIEPSDNVARPKSPQDMAKVIKKPPQKKRPLPPSIGKCDFNELKLHLTFFLLI